MVMRIHHAHVKKAERMGVLLTAKEDHVEALWAERGAKTLGKNAPEALEKMAEIQESHRNGEWEYDDPEAPAEDPVETEQPEAPTENVERSDFGVPLDGGIAHKEGFTAADCPYTSEGEDDIEYSNFERWNEEFDAAADEAEEKEPGGSVVSEKYRAIYAERGHPTHCGDDLAVILNNLCQTTKNGTDLERFEAICEANAVSLAKYNRTANGWQGRLRMTGRNMLARQVYANGGVLLTPIEGAEPSYQMSAEWMATRKFKKEAKDA